MEVSSIAVRSGVLLLSLVALSASVTELIITSQPDGTRRFCAFFLCDEQPVLKYAYKQQLEGENSNLNAAIETLRGVVSRNPASAERWVDLGDAFAAAGFTKNAEFCMARALELGSHSADVLVPAGSFYLASGKRRDGLRCLAQALALTSSFDASIFSRLAMNGVQFVEMADAGLLGNARTANAYLKYAIGERDLPKAHAAWQWIRSHDLQNAPLALEYINFLVGQKHLDEANDVWAAQFGSRVSGYRKTEYLYNGSFETDPIPNAYFDWQISPTDNVQIVRDRLNDSWSLRVQFDGSTNLDFRNVSQKLLLPPGNYRFHARVRTENLTTDQGPYFQITDPESPSRLTEDTEPMLGSTDSRILDRPFTVAANTHIVEVTMRRRPSLRFDSKIKGTIWISELSVAPR